MGIFNKIFGKKEKRFTLEEITSMMQQSQRSLAGVSVTEESALTFVPFWAAVSLIADSVGMLPLPVYRTTATGREKHYNYISYGLLNKSANPYLDSFNFRRTMTLLAVAFGNAYAEIERSDAGLPVALWILPPQLVTPTLQTIKLAGTDIPILMYNVSIAGKQETKILGDDIIHIRSLSTDGIFGRNPVKLFRDNIGVGIAAERYGARYFAGDCMPKGGIKVPTGLTDEQLTAFRKSWREQYGGVENAWRIPLLEGGMEWVKLSDSNEDSQFLETRKFSVMDVCRMFRLKPHMLGEMEKSSYASVEAQGIEFITYTLMPIMRTWEAEINNKLINSPDNSIYAEHLLEGFLRGDTLTRYQSYAVGRQWGWLSVNDIRQMENKNTIENGDIYLEPVNMVEAGKSPVPVEPQSQSNEQKALVRMAHTGLLEDIAGRIVRRHTGAVRTALKQNKSLDAVWTEQADFMRQSLLPAVRAYAVSSGNPVSVEKELSAFIDEYRKDFDAMDIDKAERDMPSKLAENILSRWG